MEDKFYKLLEYMTIGASLHDEYGNIIYANPIFCDIFNVNINSIKSKKINSDDINIKNSNDEPIVDWININFKTIKNKIIKVDIHNKTNWFKINTIKLKNGYEYYIITYENITDTVNYSYLYEQVFNDIDTGIIIIKNLNSNYYLKNINPYGLNICSIKKDDIDKNIEDLNFPIINGNNILHYIKDVWKNGTPIKLKFAKCVNNDKIFWRNISFHKNDTNQIIILFHDVTDIVNYKKMVEQSDKMKSNFLSNMSHEIRSPINAIIGFIDILENSNNKDEINRSISIIKNSSKSLIKLIDDISDMSKIEAGKITINKNKFDINSVIKNVIDTSTIKLKNNVQISCDIDINNELIINSDEHRIKQILINLMDNSIKFTKEGYINIGYSLDESFITFHVEDTGIGISDENKKYVFNRFHKADKLSKIGTGLGLSISKELVKLLNGKIWYNTNYGSGTTFYFKIPYDKVNKNKNKKQINIKQKTDYNKIDLSDKKILLVEDIDFNTKLILSYLEPTNVKIIVAETGNEALLKYNEHKNDLDLILMDIQLPEMDGNEVTQIIRTIDNNIPIIAQTAYAIKEDIDDIMQYGFDDIIKKPIIKNDLINTIVKYV